METKFSWTTCRSSITFYFHLQKCGKIFRKRTFSLPKHFLQKIGTFFFSLKIISSRRFSSFFLRQTKYKTKVYRGEINFCDFVILTLTTRGCSATLHTSIQLSLFSHENKMLVENFPTFHRWKKKNH